MNLRLCPCSLIINTIDLMKASLIAMAIVPHVLSFTCCPPQKSRTLLANQELSLGPILNILHNQQGDDDGWGEEPSKITSEPVLTSSESDMISKSKELQRLQNDISAKRNDKVNSSPLRGGGEERDLFIPIFSLIAVIGFTGLYGYEMLRLYSRGELYLPWEQ